MSCDSRDPSLCWCGVFDTVLVVSAHVRTRPRPVVDVFPARKCGLTLSFGTCPQVARGNVWGGQFGDVSCIRWWSGRQVRTLCSLPRSFLCGAQESCASGTRHRPHRGAVVVCDGHGLSVPSWSQFARTLRSPTFRGEKGCSRVPAPPCDFVWSQGRVRS